MDNQRMNFYSVSLFQAPHPLFPSLCGHVLCADAEESLKLGMFLKTFHPELDPMVRELTADSAREEVPFVHHPSNTSSAESDRFFTVKSWVKFGLGPDEPLFQEITPEKFFAEFHRRTGRPAKALIDRY